MQYLVSRYGHDQWVSNGSPSREALEAAACVTLANMLGADWPEADAQLADNADDDEREAALAVFHNDIDAVLAQLRFATTRVRRQRQRQTALSAITQFARALALQVQQ